MQDLISKNIGYLNAYKVTSKKTVADVLREIGLDGKFFVVIVNEKRADKNTVVSPEDEIFILPKIAGGGHYYFFRQFLSA